MLLGLSVLAACGSNSGGGGGSLDADEVPGALTDALCDLYDRCGLIDDVALCQSLGFVEDLESDLLAAVEAGLVIFHGDRADECIRSVAENSCSDPQLTESEACDLIFEGTLAEGSACAVREACISQECEIPACPDACCPGTCIGNTAPRRPHVTESCADSVRCIDSFCDLSSRICVPYRPAGQPCMEDYQCADDNICATVCTARPGPNEACVPGSGVTCRESGNYCSPTSMTCVPIGLTGDPCTANNQCSPLYTCGTGGECQLQPRLGEMCQGECIDASYCDETTRRCTAPQPDGATCTVNSECIHECDDVSGQCVTPPVCI